VPSHPVAPLGRRSRAFAALAEGRRVKTARVIILPTRFRNIRARFMRTLNLCITHIRAKVYTRRQVISPASCLPEFVMPPGQSVDLSLRFSPPPLSLSLARARARASLNVSCCSRIDAFALNERVKGILESIASLIASLFFFCVYTSFTRQI